MAVEKYDPLKDEFHPLKHLYALRYIDKDAVPERIVHSSDPDNLYKVRGAWWTGVKGDLKIAVDEGFIPDAQLRQQIDQFIEGVKKMKFGDNSPASMRTAEDIARANKFINEVLEKTGYANVLLDLSSFDPKIK